MFRTKLKVGADTVINKWGLDLEITSGPSSTPVSSTPVSSTPVSSTPIKGLPGIGFRRMTQDYLEYIREFRVSKNTIVDYGDLIRHEDKNFFVIGLSNSDLTYLLKLREAHKTVSVARFMDGEFNGFGYTATPVTLYTDIPMYMESIADSFMMQASGYVQSTISFVMIQDLYEVRLNDILYSSDGDVYRIVGFDRARVKNILSIKIDYDVNR